MIHIALIRLKLIENREKIGIFKKEFGKIGKSA
jgi:hypothetical protein